MFLEQLFSVQTVCTCRVRGAGIVRGFAPLTPPGRSSVPANTLTYHLHASTGPGHLAAHSLQLPFSAPEYFPLRYLFIEG